MIHLGIYRVNQITAKSIYLTFYVTHSSCLWLYAPPPTTLLIPLPLANSASCSLFCSAHFLCAGLAARSGRAAGIGAFYHPPLSPDTCERKCRTGQKTQSFPTSSLIACPKKITEDIRLLRRPDGRKKKNK